MVGDNPNFVPKDWKDRQKDWKLLQDVYDRMANVDIKTYLVQAVAETDDSFTRRADIAVFDSVYTEAINNYASLLNEFTILEDTPPDILDLKDNVDGSGDDLQSFAQGVDISCLNFGAVCIFIDPADEQGRIPPKLRQVDLADIRAPKLEVINGEIVLTRIGIEREVEEPKDGSEFETEPIKEWWVYEIGSYKVYRRDKEGNYFISREPTEMRGANGELLTRIPIVWYSALGATNYFKPPIPIFLTLAKLNIKLLNKVSELDAVESKCNMPTWKRYWNRVPDVPPPLVVGPDSAINMEINEDARLEEPSGKAIDSTQRRIESLQDRMKQISQVFLVGSDNNVQKTATEAAIESAQSKATLQGVAHQKESAYQQVFYWLNVFTDPNFLANFERNNGDVPIGGIDVNESILRVPANANDIRIVFDGFTEGLYERDVAYAKLKEIGWWPKDLDFEGNPGALE